jgi:hypothetical protein
MVVFGFMARWTDYKSHPVSSGSKVKFSSYAVDNLSNFGAATNDVPNNTAEHFFRSSKPSKCYVAIHN